MMIAAAFGLKDGQVEENIRRTRILVAAVPIREHVVPLRRIAADLAQRGHDITFVTGSQFRESVEKAGLRFVSLSGIADYP